MPPLSMIPSVADASAPSLLMCLAVCYNCSYQLLMKIHIPLMLLVLRVDSPAPFRLPPTVAQVEHRPHKSIHHQHPKFSFDIDR